jgi:hypothetical protein
LENGFARLALSGGYFVAAPMGLTVLLRDSVFFFFRSLLMTISSLPSSSQHRCRLGTWCLAQWSIFSQLDNGCRLVE